MGSQAQSNHFLVRDTVISTPLVTVRRPVNDLLISLPVHNEIALDSSVYLHIFFVSSESKKPKSNLN